MGRVQDKDVEQAEPPEAGTSTSEPPGRVEVDSRGHNVWRWTRETNDSTSVVLKRLDNEELALEPTQKVPVVPTPEPASKGAPSKSAAPKGASPKGASPKGASPKGAAPKGAAKSAAPKRAATKGTPPKAKKPASNTEEKAVFHPALQPDPGRDGGGGFDPYNSR